MSLRICFVNVKVLLDFSFDFVLKFCLFSYDTVCPLSVTLKSWLIQPLIRMRQRNMFVAP